MKVAIVGTSVDLTQEETDKITTEVSRILAKYSKDTIIISGGAKGVDQLAIETAKMLEFKTEVLLPQKQNWKNFKIRNISIAKQCDALYCLSVINRSNTSKCYHHAKHEKHEKTAGCWTLAKAAQLDKTCELIVV